MVVGVGLGWWEGLESGAIDLVVEGDDRPATGTEVRDDAAVGVVIADHRKGLLQGLLGGLGGLEGVGDLIGTPVVRGDDRGPVGVAFGLGDAFFGLLHLGLRLAGEGEGQVDASGDPLDLPEGLVGLGAGHGGGARVGCWVGWKG